MKPGPTTPNCPACGIAWATTDGYSRVIGIEIPGLYDGISYWQCPDCHASWDRWTGERSPKTARPDSAFSVFNDTEKGRITGNDPPLSVNKSPETTY
jgi:hypothetical protein